ncbi:MAG: hypothetical protein ACI86H_003059 [bacterium]|jgi:hypothetical protein
MTLKVFIFLIIFFPTLSFAKPILFAVGFHIPPYIILNSPQRPGIEHEIIVQSMKAVQKKITSFIYQMLEPFLNLKRNELMQ